MSEKYFRDFEIFEKSILLQKINITKFANCDDVSDVKVNLTSVQYVYNDDGLCDTIHGKYYVHTTYTGRNYEVSYPAYN